MSQVIVGHDAVFVPIKIITRMGPFLLTVRSNKCSKQKCNTPVPLIFNFLFRWLHDPPTNMQVGRIRKVLLPKTLCFQTFFVGNSFLTIPPTRKVLVKATILVNICAIIHFLAIAKQLQKYQNAACSYQIQSTWRYCNISQEIRTGNLKS